MAPSRCVPLPSYDTSQWYVTEIFTMACCFPVTLVATYHILLQYSNVERKLAQNSSNLIFVLRQQRFHLDKTVKEDLVLLIHRTKLLDMQIDRKGNQPTFYRSSFRDVLSCVPELFWLLSMQRQGEGRCPSHYYTREGSPSLNAPGSVCTTFKCIDVCSAFSSVWRSSPT